MDDSIINENVQAIVLCTIEIMLSDHFQFKSHIHVAHNSVCKKSKEQTESHTTHTLYLAIYDKGQPEKQKNVHKHGQKCVINS